MVARAYLGAQAGCGAGWWLAVFLSDDVRRHTLGRWDPRLVVLPDLLFFVGASALAAASRHVWPARVAAVWTTAITIALGIHGLVARTAGLGVVAMALATIGTVGSALTIAHGRLPTAWFFSGPFAFRVAPSAQPGGHLRRSLAQLVVFWIAFFVLVPAVLTVIERRLRIDLAQADLGPSRSLGLGAFLAGSAIGLWSCVTMAIDGQGTPLPARTARELVTRGPYRYVRNPMALAGAVQTVSVGLIVGSWLTVVVGVTGALAWNSVIRPVEEADMASRFGPRYEAYRARVRCWLPTWGVVPDGDRRVPRMLRVPGNHR